MSLEYRGYRLTGVQGATQWQVNITAGQMGLAPIIPVVAPNEAEAMRRAKAAIDAHLAPRETTAR